jgi:hypothetical protein
MLSQYTCQKCHYTWTPNVDNPKRCPNPECQTRDWNPLGIYHHDALYPSEKVALNWLIKSLGINKDCIYKSHTSPDYHLTDGRVFEAKLLKNITLQISLRQLELLHNYPNCKIIVFRPTETEPIANFLASDVKLDDKETTAFGKFGQFQINLI